MKHWPALSSVCSQARPQDERAPLAEVGRIGTAKWPSLRQPPVTVMYLKAVAESTGSSVDQYTRTATINMLDLFRP